MSRRSQWLILAVASGACAAFNGVFAKLYVVTSRLHTVCTVISISKQDAYHFKWKNGNRTEKATIFHLFQTRLLRVLIILMLSLARQQS